MPERVTDKARSEKSAEAVVIGKADEGPNEKEDWKLWHLAVQSIRSRGSRSEL